MKHRIIEHYELLRRLGAGGSGVVYLANDMELMRPVVLKVLKRGSLTAEQMRTTVLREARMASAIEHPNVCAIYEIGEEGEEAYIVMQYVPGQPLDKLIAKGPASLQLVLSVGIQIADGLNRRALAGHLSSRSQTSQRHPHRWRPDQDSRLRTRAAGSIRKRATLTPRRQRRARPAPSPLRTPRVAAPSPTWRRSSFVTGQSSVREAISGRSA